VLRAATVRNRSRDELERYIVEIILDRFGNDVDDRQVNREVRDAIMAVHDALKAGRDAPDRQLSEAARIALGDIILFDMAGQKPEEEDAVLVRLQAKMRPMVKTSEQENKDANIVAVSVDVNTIIKQTNSEPYTMMEKIEEVIATLATADAQALVRGALHEGIAKTHKMAKPHGVALTLDSVLAKLDERWESKKKTAGVAAKGVETKALDDHGQGALMMWVGPQNAFHKSGGKR